MPTEKKKAYAEYQQARQEMQEILTAKANVERLLGTEEQNTEKERKRNYCKGEVCGNFVLSPKTDLMFPLDSSSFSYRKKAHSQGDA